jgi:hypothetical protein
MSMGKGPIGLEGRWTCSLSTLARGSLAFGAGVSPGVKMTVSFQSNLARALFGLQQMARHHAIMGREVGNAVNRRSIER